MCSDWIIVLGCGFFCMICLRELVSVDLPGPSLFYLTHTPNDDDDRNTLSQLLCLLLSFRLHLYKLRSHIVLSHFFVFAVLVYFGFFVDVFVYSLFIITLISLDVALNVSWFFLYHNSHEINSIGKIWFWC